MTPTLAVRYPGRRELHHPAPAAAARLFPSFGLALETLPYAERVLWQAFAFEAFDPHAEGVPTLTQVRTGHLVLRRR